MDRLKYVIICGWFIFTLGLSLTASENDLFHQGFSHQGKGCFLSVEPSWSGFDIFLTDGNSRENLSRDFTGENLFPHFQVRGDHLYITWVSFNAPWVYPCYYDPVSGIGFRIPVEGFRFLSSPVLVFQGSSPRGLVFLGNRGYKSADNKQANESDEVFAYDLVSRRLIDITQTPEHEKKFSVIEKAGGFVVDTETIPYKAAYKVRWVDFQVEETEKHPREIVPRKKPSPPSTLSPTAYNTIVGFGDSITWGKISMRNLVGDYHPELAFLNLIKTNLTENYGTVYTVNLGVPGETSYNAIQRLPHDFMGLEAFFCLIMFGTNDVTQNTFSAASSLENLRWICTHIRDECGMYPIISTIPPMNRITGGQYKKENSELLNAGIIQLAQELNISYIDTYAAFLAYPDWEDLIEDILNGHIVGNHPSPAGHQVIADLFIPKILAVPPLPPSDLRAVSVTSNRVTVEWTANYEFDFSHYVVEFGFSPGNLNRRVTTTNGYFYFLKPPLGFYSTTHLYWRVQAWDKYGVSSGFSGIVETDFK